jgi:hypothetical protein
VIIWCHHQRHNSCLLTVIIITQVRTLSATLTTTEASYINLTQQIHTIETELRFSLEELHIEEQQQQHNGNGELSLLTEDECDRLIRESQSAMVCNGV